ncbi:SDR family oxidoreductase [Flaviflexus ciconiae]|uniref:SDR family oxidoreductase n=1 Tax=Flaviflexus ciconiae TaxID=2496867 RepID=A0A3Q9G904_9ACTO|nr:SDR family oxidoreductase [Flaviflexus ciconiae]AZQ77919.1 SDR family oxidoreductase [Flaviflexus ciconiae]
MNEEINRFSMDYFRLEGRVAIVTGGNQGLGMAYAAAFAKAGADLYIPHFAENVDEIKAIVEAEGRKVAFLQGDLADSEYVDRVVEDCIDTYGRIDILVNNAGMSRFGAFEEYRDEDYRACMELNLNACYFLGRKVGLKMAEQGSGKIINIASALSFTSDKHCPPYTIAKHGILGLTKVLANELGSKNVQANALAPGFLATEVNAELRADEKFYNKITDRISLGRWGRLDDLMGSAVFLASQASDYVNGWTLNVDGGFAATV